MHLRAGKSLQALRAENVLIVGSGISYHNMRGFGSIQGMQNSRLFDVWLNDAMAQGDCAALVQWKAAPAAIACHPREEHLIPLMVAAGAADGAPGGRIFSGQPMGVAVSAFRFDDRPPPRDKSDLRNLRRLACLFKTN